MRIPCNLVALLVFCLLLTGCGGKQSEESSKNESAKPGVPQAAEPQDAATPAQKQPAAASAEPAKPAAQSAPKPAPATKETKAAPKDVAILKGAAIGAVKFEHKLHAERVGKKCETCHHASRPEKPSTARQESCLDCHTRPPAPGMKTGLPAAFHNAVAKAGVCIDCHQAENTRGKKAPTKCVDCHKKENT